MGVEPKLSQSVNVALLLQLIRKAPRMCFGCNEWSSHSLSLIVMRCIPSQPVIFHFCCNGTWFLTMLPPPSLKVHCVFLCTPGLLKCCNSLPHSLLILSVYSPDEDSCQKFVPFIGVRATSDTCFCVLSRGLTISLFMQVVKVGIVEQSLSTSGSNVMATYHITYALMTLS